MKQNDFENSQAIISISKLHNAAEIEIEERERGYTLIIIKCLSSSALLFAILHNSLCSARHKTAAAQEQTHVIETYGFWAASEFETLYAVGSYVASGAISLSSCLVKKIPCEIA